MADILTQQDIEEELLKLEVYKNKDTKDHGGIVERIKTRKYKLRVDGGETPDSRYLTLFITIGKKKLIVVQPIPNTNTVKITVEKYIPEYLYKELTVDVTEEDIVGVVGEYIGTIQTS